MADARRIASAIALALSFASTAFAADAPAEVASDAAVRFQPPTAAPTAADPALEARMLAITGELRCLVCQNQTIADSHADLAVDLRQEVREMLRHGRTPDEIRRYMTDRYGDFVLYRPPLKASTVVLWLGPAALLAIALVGLTIVIRRRARLADDHFEADPVFDGDTPEPGSEPLSRTGTPA